MEAVGYLGGAFAIAGVMTFLAQLRRRVHSYKVGGALVVLGIAMAGSAYYVATRPVAASARPASPVTSAPNAPAQASPALAIPSTVAAFQALGPTQGKAVMQQELDRYNSVLNQAYTNLDASLLPEVTTGPALQYEQQQLEGLKAQGKPIGEEGSYTITAIGPAPALGSVSVRTEGTDQTWYLDPTTHQRVGQPSVNSSPATYTMVPEDGVWKVEVVVLG
jgi:hypothetical protein